MFLYFYSSTVKFELWIPQNFFPETSLTFASTVFLVSVDSHWRLLWLNNLPVWFNFLPALHNNYQWWSLQMSFFFFGSFCLFVCFWSGHVYALNLLLVIIYLSNYLLSELSLYPLLAILGSLSHLAFDSKCCFLISWLTIVCL